MACLYGTTQENTLLPVTWVLNSRLSASHKKEEEVFATCKERLDSYLLISPSLSLVKSFSRNWNRNVQRFKISILPGVINNNSEVYLFISRSY